MPSSQILSVETLKKIKAFYEAGGKILATNQLPGKSAEFGQDNELRKLIKEIFGINPLEPMPDEQVSASNQQGGKAIFLPLAEKDVLTKTIEILLPHPDVHIEQVKQLDQPDALHRPLVGVDEYRNLPSEKLGMLSYIHKQKNGKDIYLFANSTDHPVKTNVALKGKLTLETWNPYTGSIEKKVDIKYQKKENGITYTTFTLNLFPVNSIFIIGEQ